MSEPYIIRCFNNQLSNKKGALENKRKELEQKIQQEAERQNHKKVVEQAISAQEEKEKKIIKKLKEIQDQSERKLN